MNILVTGARGMVGTALVNNLRNIRDGKNRTRPNIIIDEIFEYDIDSSEEQLEEYCKISDFIFNLAGVNRPKESSEYMNGNYQFALKLIELLKKYGNKATIMVSSSIQASLVGRFSDSDYGKSKSLGEDIFFNYSKECCAKVAVYRFPNLMGHSKPNYNSAVSTFCNAIANDLEYYVSDPSIELELLYIDDLIEGMFDLLEGKEKHCEYKGLDVEPVENGKYCYVPITYKVTLGRIVELLEGFKRQIGNMYMPSMPQNSFEKKLYSLYLTYLPKHKFKRSLKMNKDYRGSFTELLHTEECGQVSVNICKPGITKGQHWHNSKWELFIVVSGKALIQERNINTGEKVEFYVSGEEIEVVSMIPGWAHNIINLSEEEELITIMICNENFEQEKPDTFSEIV